MDQQFNLDDLVDPREATEVWPTIFGSPGSVKGALNRRRTNGLVEAGGVAKLNGKLKLVRPGVIRWAEAGIERAS